MASFPAIRACIDWAGLVRAPLYAQFVAAMRNRSAFLGSDYGWSAYARLDDAPGSPAADELMGNVTATATNVMFGAAPALGRDSATSARFAGTGSVAFAGPEAPLVGLTFVALVNPDGGPGYLWSSGTGGIGVRLDASCFVVLTVPGTGDVCTATVALVPGKWTHVVVTYDEVADARIYLDGADVSGTTTVRALAGSATAYLGANGTADGFSGGLAEVAYGWGVMKGSDVAYIASLARSPWSEVNADMTGIIAEPLTIKRGRSSDYGSDAASSCSFTLPNAGRLFDPLRNWADNGSLETDLSGWTIDAGPYISAGSFLARVRDTAGYGGQFAAEVAVGSGAFAGVAYDLAYPVRAGIEYGLFLALKSITGSTALTIIVGDRDDVGNATSTDVTITGSWAGYTLSWTPAASADNVRVAIRGNAATFRIDALSFAAGPPLAFVEAPTRGQLVPGTAVLIVADHEAVEAPLFFGAVTDFSPNASDLSVVVTCQDVFAELGRLPVLIGGGFSGTHLGFRAEVLRRAFAGWRNLDRGGWVLTGATVTRARALMDIPAGQAIRFSGMIRVAAGPGVAAGTISTRMATYAAGATPSYVDLPITSAVGGNWVPFTATMKTTAADRVEYGFTGLPTSMTVEVRDIVLSAGPEARPFVPYGETHQRAWGHNAAFRNANADLHGGFWTPAPVNRCGNPSFEMNTSGWVADADGFVSAGATFTRTAGGFAGSWSARLAAGAVGQGAYYALSGTFVKGQPCVVTAWVRGVGTSAQAAIGIGYGPDSAATWVTAPTTGWTRIDLVWTPTAHRTGVDVFVYPATGGSLTFDVDAVIVCTAPNSGSDVYLLGWADPLGLDPVATESVIGRYSGDGYAGNQCMMVASGNAIAFPLQRPGPLAANAAVGWELFESRTAYAAAIPPRYTASVWVRTAAVGTTVVLSLGRQSDPANAASTTLVTKTTNWTRMVVHWNSYAGSPPAVGDVWVVIRGDAGMKVDALLVTEGALAWSFAPWTDGLDRAEADWLIPSVTPTGSALSALSSLNAANMTRHWIDPLAVWPYWQYRTRAASSLPGKTVAETYDDDVSAITGASSSFDTIANVAQVTPSGRYVDPTYATGSYVPANSGYTGEVWASDATSVARYTRSDASPISGDFWENRPGDVSLQASIAAMAVDRYRAVRPRPTIVVENRWPSQLVRGPDDLIALEFPRLGLRRAPYLITSLQHDISATGRYWRTSYALEEFGFGEQDASLAGGLPEHSGTAYTLPTGMPM